MAKKKPQKKTAKKATKKSARKPALTGVTPRARGKLGALDKKTLELIETTADRVQKSIFKRTLPELKFPVRSLANVTYDKRRGYFELGKGRKLRALSVNTVKNFAQTLRLMSISKEMIENNDFATKREAYYVSKNWAEAKFNEQTESDAVMDDIEALASLEALAEARLRDLASQDDEGFVVYLASNPGPREQDVPTVEHDGHHHTLH